MSNSLLAVTSPSTTVSQSPTVIDPVTKPRGSVATRTLYSGASTVTAISVRAIIGGVVAGVILVVILVVLGVCISRWRRKANVAANDDVAMAKAPVAPGIAPAANYGRIEVRAPVVDEYEIGNVAPASTVVPSSQRKRTSSGFA